MPVCSAAWPRSRCLAASLPVLWSPPLFRENWRAAADYISDYQQHSPHSVTAALVHPYFLFPALDWYLRQDASTTELPVYGNFGGPLTPEQAGTLIADHLQEMTTTNGADTLWLAQSHLAGVDDHRLVQAWLDSNFALITEQYPAGVELRGYAVSYKYPTLPALPETAVYPDAQLFSRRPTGRLRDYHAGRPRARHPLSSAQWLGPSAAMAAGI